MAACVTGRPERGVATLRALGRPAEPHKSAPLRPRHLVRWAGLLAGRDHQTSSHDDNWTWVCKISSSSV